MLPKLGPNTLPEPMQLEDSVQLLGAEDVLIKGRINSMLMSINSSSSSKIAPIYPLFSQLMSNCFSKSTFGCLTFIAIFGIELGLILNVNYIVFYVSNLFHPH
jgi:hypothetical protein